MSERSTTDLTVHGDAGEEQQQILSDEALSFLSDLHARFEPDRSRLLDARRIRQKEISRGELPKQPPTTAAVRERDWVVAEAPADLLDRRVEITGPVDRKMVINALNSGARVFMADFEDSLSPTWQNIVEGQVNLRDAIRRKVDFVTPEGKQYRLAEKTATLVLRPRGWHLVERHLTVAGEPISASLFDFGLYFFHNAKELLSRGSGPYFYLPKLEGHEEARLWNEVFVFAQERLGIPRGTIRATVLIETVLAAFEMDEILWELREHASGLNAGRWDYIFSAIKKFRERTDMVLPDRSLVTMTVPFMKSYTDRLVAVSHRRGAHAMGGMAAFIPNRRDPDVTERALELVKQDKQREARDGFDGTWVAHPDLVSVAKTAFDEVLGTAPHQKQRVRDDVPRRSAAELLNVATELLNVTVPGGKVTMGGVENNVSVALQYIEAWLRGTGAVAINNLMEDAATAEISRAQLWQWIRHSVPIDEGGRMDADLYRAARRRELERLQSTAGGGDSRFHEAAELLDRLVLSEDFAEFLTMDAYNLLS
ncbi:malate synthase A [soil metagenome]